MSIYHRFASFEHDEAFFSKINKKRPKSNTPKPKKTVQILPQSLEKPESNGSRAISSSVIKLPPLGGHFDEINHAKKDQDQQEPRTNNRGWKGARTGSSSNTETSLQEWLEIFPTAAYFTGYDESLFGNSLIVIYQNPTTGRINTKSITKFGVTTYENLILDSRSRFWPSCENLLPEFRRSNVRRAMAITNLKNYNRLSNHHFETLNLSRAWDETNAGSLANQMYLLTEKTPVELGNKLLQLGLIQSHTMQSVLLDTVYDNISDQATPKIVEDNNKMVYLLGEQLDQLFDPLLEYSPEAMNINYNAQASSQRTPLLLGNEKIDTIISEFISIQTNYTMGLVNLLQNFIIPLRIHVLAQQSASNNKSSASGISKINHVFPPTIDEITRINCILHDSLNKAKHYGYLEIFKVVGMILPYFYKAFIRHEANLKNFASRLNKFSQKNYKKIFENKNLNKGDYSVREIDSIVSGSLFELPRFKLLLKRLYDAIYNELVIYRKTQALENEEMSLIQHHYSIAIGVIDAFGGRLPDGEETDSAGKAIEHNPKHRFFTPSGKILTELASKWPAELQYDWLTRKVVGVFELKNLKPLGESIFDIDVLIIFSDYLLFMTIVDTKYYLRKEEDPQKTISVSDILMHSLINEKPLPSLDIFPSMEVNGWCEIDQVITSSYRSISTFDKDVAGEFLRFLSTKSHGFNSSSSHTNYTKNYEILKVSEGESGSKILELITKSKVLHKSQAFHLFKSSALPNNTSTISVDSVSSKELVMYTTAHSVDAYELETCKSPFALFLNITIDEPFKYFESHQDLYLIINASFVSDESIQLVGLTRDGQYELNNIIRSSDLQWCLKKIICTVYELLFKNHNSVTDTLGKGYKNDLDYYLNVFTSYNSERLKMKEKQIENDKVIEEKRRQSEAERRSMPATPKTPQNKVMPAQITSPKTSVPKSPITKTPTTPTPKLTKKKSIIHKFFSSFKKKEPKEKVQPEKEKPAEPVRKISNTYIPRGEKAEFSNLYKPIPELRKYEGESIQEEATPGLGLSKIQTGRNSESLDRVSSRATSIPQYSIDIQYAPATSDQKVRRISFKNTEELPTPQVASESRRSSQFNGDEQFVSVSEEPKHSKELSKNIQDYSKFDNSRFNTTNQTAISNVSIPRSISEQNVMALESLQKQRRKSGGSKLSLSFLDLPAEEFYVDGETNWITLSSRDNSNLSTEVKKLREEQILEENAAELSKGSASLVSTIDGASTLDFGKSTTSLVEDANALADRFMLQFDEEQERKEVNEIFKARHESSSTFEVPANYFVKNSRDVSIQSLSSAQVIEEFKKTIDFDSDLDQLDFTTTTFDVSRNGSRSSAGTIDGGISRNGSKSSSQSSNGAYQASKSKGFTSQNLSNVTLTSSEEEYYSPNEFDFSNSIYKMIDEVQSRSRISLIRKEQAQLTAKEKAMQKRHSQLYGTPLGLDSYDQEQTDSPQTFTSSSSDATITNNVEPSRKLPTLPSERYLTRDDSIAYLSDILNGSIQL